MATSIATGGSIHSLAAFTFLSSTMLSWLTSCRGRPPPISFLFGALSSVAGPPPTVNLLSHPPCDPHPPFPTCPPYPTPLENTKITGGLHPCSAAWKAVRRRWPPSAHQRLSPTGNQGGEWGHPKDSPVPVPVKRHDPYPKGLNKNSTITCAEGSDAGKSPKSNTRPSTRTTLSLAAPSRSVLRVCVCVTETPAGVVVCSHAISIALHVPPPPSHFSY